METPRHPKTIMVDPEMAKTKSTKLNSMDSVGEISKVFQNDPRKTIKTTRKMDQYQQTQGIPRLHFQQQRHPVDPKQ
jgi:hypothetical protein